MMTLISQSKQTAVLVGPTCQQLEGTRLCRIGLLRKQPEVESVEELESSQALDVLMGRFWAPGGPRCL